MKKTILFIAVFLAVKSYSQAWSGTTLTGNTYRVDNVGIGISNPTEKLHVGGNGVFSGRGLFGNYPAGTVGKVGTFSLEVGGPNPSGTAPDATIYFHHHGILANQLRYNAGNFFFEKTSNGWGTAPPNVIVEGRGLFGKYPSGTVGKIGTYSLEVGGPTPSGTAPDATIYFHHHGVLANQLRYNAGNFFFEKTSNGWGTSSPNIIVEGRGLFGNYPSGTVGKIGTPSLEVGGLNPTGSAPDATIFFHHHGASANQLRYNAGTFFFEKTSNGWGTLDPKIVIGNVPAVGNYSLYVSRGILTEKVKVALSGTANWADYVFSKNYKLKSLSEVESYIKENKHLPNIPSSEEIKADGGLDVAEMMAKQMEKIEELTLYTIQQQKEIEELKNLVKSAVKK